MKVENAIARIEKVITNRNIKAYKLVMEALQLKKNTIRPCSVSGRGRFATNLDYTNATMRLLDDAGIKYAFTNDSPRGGLPGNLITLTHIAY